MKRKALSITLTLCVILSLFAMPAMAADAEFTDVSGHWAQDAIEIWAQRDILKGEDGKFRPNDFITRAEMAALLNRVIGYIEVTETEFTDVSPGAWYYSDIIKLYAAGIMEGDGAGTMRPAANITREEAVVLVGRAFDLPYMIPPTWLPGGGLDPDAFPDTDDISGWASPLVYSMKFSGYVSGDSNGNFNPKSNITRAEVVTILNNMVELYFDEAGEFDCELIGEIDGGVLINAPGITIKNLTTKGELWITEGVGDGDVTLENVNVAGDTHIRGGGSNSIHIKGGSFTYISVGGSTQPRLDISGGATIVDISVFDSAIVVQDGVTITFDAETDSMTIGGTIDSMTLYDSGSAYITIGDTVFRVYPPEDNISGIVLDSNAVIKELELDTGVDISGTGKIEKAVVNADGVDIDSSVNIKTENISVAEDVEVTVGDKEYTGEGTTLPRETETGGGVVYPAVNSVTVTPATVNTLVGTAIDDQQLTATVSVSGGAADTVTWSVHSEGTTGSGKVTITEDGKLNVANDATKGTAIIRATSTVDSSKYGECTVIVEYALTYDLNGGTGTAPTDTTAYANGDNATVTSTVPAHASKTFFGWNTAADGSGYLYEPGITIVIQSSETVLYAIWQGDGATKSNPVLIKDATGLQAMKDGLNKHYKLVRDVTVGEWIPVGERNTSERFTGSLDGNGKVVTFDAGDGAAVNVADTEYVSLFGCIGTGGSVKNLTVAGKLSASNSASTESVYIGGVAGELYAGTISNCAVTADVTGTVNGAAYAGGVTGYCSNGTVSGCYSSGRVSATSATGNASAGGIAAYLFGNTSTATEIRDCYASGNVTAIASTSAVVYRDAYAGGIVGKSYSSFGATSVLRCYASMANVSASGGKGQNYAGGIVGSNFAFSGADNSVSNCVALVGNVAASGDGTNNTGRVAAFNSGTLSDNYGLDAMQRNNGDGNWTSSDTGIDGADVTAAAAGTEGWWFRDSGIWKGFEGDSDAAPWCWDGTRPVLYWNVLVN